MKPFHSLLKLISAKIGTTPYGELLIICDDEDSATKLHAILEEYQIDCGLECHGGNFNAVILRV